MKFFVTIFFIWMGLLLNAGNIPFEKAKADFSKVNVTYSATPVFSMDIQYSVYDNHIGGNLIEQKNGKYYKSNQLTYTKVLNIETVVNTKSTVIVNNDEKVLVITDTKKIELSPIQTNMDTLLKMCSSIRYTDIGKTERQYILDFSKNENSEFSKIEVSINLTNYTIKKVIMFYNEAMSLNQDNGNSDKKPRLEIIYKTFSSMTKIDESLFAEATYLSLVGDKYKGKGKYLNYKIINQLQSSRFKKK